MAAISANKRHYGFGEKMKPVKWYQRREVWGTALTLLSFTPEILSIFPQHTLAFKIATPIGLILTTLGLRAGQRDKNLPWNKLPEGIKKDE